MNVRVGRFSSEKIWSSDSCLVDSAVHSSTNLWEIILSGGGGVAGCMTFFWEGGGRGREGGIMQLDRCVLCVFY